MLPIFHPCNKKTFYHHVRVLIYISVPDVFQCCC